MELTAKLEHLTSKARTCYTTLSGMFNDIESNQVLMYQWLKALDSEIQQKKNESKTTGEEEKRGYNA